MPSSAAHVEERPERARSAAWWALAVTALMGMGARLPWPQASGTAVTLVFFGAVWLAVWRRSDAVVREHGLALGGLMGSQADGESAVAKAWARALGWALAMSCVVLLPFALLWRPVVLRLGWPGLHAFALHRSSAEWAALLATQLLVVALAEEAFYRGVLQTRFERSFPHGLALAGGVISVGNVLTSVMFALGHVATRTDPVHLLVFFPSLLFGWLRTRTKGIEAGMLFHAFCNMLSAMLFEGFLG